MGQREIGAPVAFFLFVVVSSFIVLDLYLFMTLDEMPSGAIFPYSRNTSENPCYISPFCQISTKTMTLGWADFYIHRPFSTLLNQVLHLNKIISADFVSVLRVVVCLVSVKFLANESLSVRRFGYMMYEFGSMCDSLDGAIARANQAIKPKSVTYDLYMDTKKNEGPPNVYGPNSIAGYFFDGICDGIIIMFVMATCVVYLQRYSPAKKHNVAAYTHLSTVTINSDFGCETKCVKCCGERRKDKVDDEDYNSEVGCCTEHSKFIFPIYHHHHFQGKLINVAKGMINAAIKYALKPCRSILEGCTGGPGFCAVLVGFQILIASIFWNRNIIFFVTVLEHPESKGLSSTIASETIHSPVMWLIFFGWRILNPLILAEYVALAIFMDRTGDLLRLMQYSGFFFIAALATISEVYRAELNTIMGSA